MNDYDKDAYLTEHKIQKGKIIAQLISTAPGWDRDRTRPGSTYTNTINRIEF